MNAAELPTAEGLLEEAHRFNESVTTVVAQRRMARFREVGGQTRSVELDLESVLGKLAG